MPRKKTEINIEPDISSCEDAGAESQTDEEEHDYVQELVNKYAGAKRKNDTQRGEEPPTSVKVCSEKQAAHLAKTREKALQVRRELAAKRKAEKEAEKRRKEEERILAQAEKLREQERRIEARLRKEQEELPVATRIRRRTPIPKPAKKRVVVVEKKKIPRQDFSSDEESEEEEPVRKIPMVTKKRTVNRIAKDTEKTYPQPRSQQPPATIRRMASLFDDII